MNTQDAVKEIARREALAAALTDSAKVLRDELRAKALDEYAREGSGVTWTVRDLGRVTLPLTTEQVVVSNIAALLEWCQERHSEHVETVEQVSAKFQRELLDNAVVTEDGKVLSPDGEAVPGLSVREGGRPKPLTITIEHAAKSLYAQWARGEVERMLVQEYGEVPDAAA